MANNASLTISVISLVVSLISVSCVLLRCEPMTMDWMGMLVGILSLLVTISDWLADLQCFAGGKKDP